VVDLGFLDMLDLSYRARDPDETYGEWYWTEMMTFSQKKSSFRSNIILHKFHLGPVL
jgi:hypothetical protein